MASLDAPLAVVPVRHSRYRSTGRAPAVRYKWRSHLARQAGAGWGALISRLAFLNGLPPPLSYLRRGGGVQLQRVSAPCVCTAICRQARVPPLVSHPALYCRAIPICFRPQDEMAQLAVFLPKFPAIHDRTVLAAARFACPNVSCLRKKKLKEEW